MDGEETKTKMETLNSKKTAAPCSSHCSSALQHWGVDVRLNGEDVLTIESNCLFGKSELSAMELDAIRTAANHLLAFAGKPTRHRMNQILEEI